MFILKKKGAKSGSTLLKDSLIMLGYFGGLRLLYVASVNLLKN